MTKKNETYDQKSYSRAEYLLTNGYISGKSVSELAAEIFANRKKIDNEKEPTNNSKLVAKIHEGSGDDSELE